MRALVLINLVSASDISVDLGPVQCVEGGYAGSNESQGLPVPA